MFESVKEAADLEAAEEDECVRRVIQARAGGRVERCHGIPHHGSYNNATHSWGVAMLMYYLWPEDFARLVMACLSHDVPEAWLGDVPAPTMRYVPGLKAELGALERDVNLSLGLPAEQDLSDEDHAKLKACDRLEFYLWCREQLRFGNGFVEESMREVERYFEEVPLPERAQRFYLRLRERSVLPKQAGVVKELCE